jgi:hypothetical protein
MGTEVDFLLAAGIGTIREELSQMVQHPSLSSPASVLFKGKPPPSDPSYPGEGTDALNLRGDFELGLLTNVAIVKTRGT